MKLKENLLQNEIFQQVHEYIIEANYEVVDVNNNPLTEYDAFCKSDVIQFIKKNKIITVYREDNESFEVISIKMKENTNLLQKIIEILKENNKFCKEFEYLETFECLLG